LTSVCQLTESFNLIEVKKCVNATLSFLWY